jgi:hypothetical protein
MNTTRIVVSFSCGAASAVAAKISVARWGDEREVVVINCDMSEDEHPDNQRFMADVERWIGQPVVRLSNPKYKSVDDVFAKVRYIVGISGAACAKRMKREVVAKFKRPDDVSVIGFTVEEQDRIAEIEINNPNETFWWVLADRGITKQDCYGILQAEGIELPAMYRMGYGHNNCIGCVKGGKGYWNKIRRDFPDVFWKRARQQRDIGCAFRSGGADFWLDELTEDEGRDVQEPQIECGVFCSHYSDLIQVAVEKAI